MHGVCDGPSWQLDLITELIAELPPNFYDDQMIYQDIQLVLEK